MEVLTLEQCEDMRLIASISRDERIYRTMADDHSPAPGDYEPPSGAIYVVVREDTAVRGMWVLDRRTHVKYEVHTLLLPGWPLQDKLRAAAMMAQWVWDNTPCVRLVTEVPVTNRAAIWFARKAGMVEFGRDPKSYAKGGELHDTVLLGMSRMEDLRA